MKKEERNSYIKALLFIALSDQSLEQEEVDHLIKVGEKNGLSREESEDLMYESLCSKETLREILDGIEKKDTKEELIRDLLVICYADGHYSKQEWEGVSIISNMLGIKGKTLGKIHDEVRPKEKRRNKDKKKIDGALASIKDNIADALEAGLDGIDSAKDFVVDGGADAVHAIAHSLSRFGETISVTLASAKAIKEQNVALRKRLEQSQFNEATKQKIIIKLDAEIENLRAQLQEEEEKGQMHAEAIEEMNAALNELIRAKTNVSGRIAS